MITKKDVLHIAQLARIELTPEEEEKFGRDLSAILEFAEELNGADTEGVEPLTGGTLLQNVMRDDSQVDPDLQGNEPALLDSAPEKKQGYVKVRAVFE